MLALAVASLVGGGAVTVAVVRRWPRAASAGSPAAVRALVVAAAAGAVVAPGAPAGLAPADAAWRALAGGALAMAASRARRWAWLTAGAVAAVAAPPSRVAVAAAFGSLGIALASAPAPRRGRVAGAVVGAVLFQALTRLGWPALQGGSAGAAAGSAAVLAVSALRQSSRSTRRRVAAAAFALAVPAGAAGAAWAVAVVDARAQFAQAVAASREGLAATVAGRPAEAAAALRQASAAFDRAGRSLGSWWAAPARALPLVGPHARALAVTSSTGATLAAAAARAAAAAADPALALDGGRVDPGAVAALDAPVRASLAALERGLADVRAVRSGWLVAPLQQDLATLEERLVRAGEQARPLAAAIRVLPGMLGRDGPRRYFVALQTPSELRGAGGFIGSYAELTVSGGRLQLTRLGRIGELNPPAGTTYSLDGPIDYLARYDRFGPRRYVQNATLSPDFPSDAAVIEQLYPQAGGLPVDGVIGVDPVALARLLAVTGPVRVPNWPVPIGADNAEQVLLHDQYLHLGGEAREELPLQVARAVFDALVATGVRDWGEAVATLAPAVRGRHLMVHAVRPDEQAAIAAVGLAGAMGPVRGDYLQVVTQNGGENKIDWYLRRAVTYRAEVDPATGAARATVSITLTNTAPATGVPPIVIGGDGSPYPAGVNRLYLSVYSPLGFDGATLDGRPLPMQSERELARNVFSQFLSVGPGQRVRVVVHLVGTLRPGPYRLDIGRQPTVAPDTLAVEVRDRAGRVLVRHRGPLTADLRLGNP